MEIYYLDFDVTSSCSSQIYASDVIEGNITDYDVNCLIENTQFDNFRCPECEEILFFYEEDARRFLKRK